MLKIYLARFKNEFFGYNLKSLGKDAMAGITVAAVALPLALAFGVSCGADAAAGLITAIIAGFIISALSGASFQISGPTGAMTAILVTVVARYQLQGVFVVGVIAGIFILLVGLFRLGKLVKIIPTPVVTGFTSGIAIIIVLGQIDNFFGIASVGKTALEKLLSYGRLGVSPNYQAIITGFIVVFIMMLWPKNLNARIPSSLIGIITATIISTTFKFNVAVVGEIPRTLLPQARLNILSVDWTGIPNYISSAFTVAALAIIESLLCGASASRMKNESFDADLELMAQGIGNIIIPFFGGVPATAAIARTSVAIKSGCQTRMTGIFHAMGLLLSMFLLGPVMSKLPLASLAGVLFVTAWRMNEWHSIKQIFSKKFKGAMSQFMITMIATVVFDLTIAIAIGIIVAAIIFISSSMKIDISANDVDEEKLKVKGYEIEKYHLNATVVYITGSIFFANFEKLTEFLSSYSFKNELILSMRGVSHLDTNASQELCNALSKIEENGVRVILCCVQPSVLRNLKRAGIHEFLHEERFFWSVDMALSHTFTKNSELKKDKAIA